MVPINGSPSNTLRVGGTGEESSSPDAEAVSQPKVKKGYIDKDYHGFFRLNGALCRFTTYSGRRYVNLLDVVDEKFLTTIGGMR